MAVLVLPCYPAKDLQGEGITVAKLSRPENYVWRRRTAVEP